MPKLSVPKTINPTTVAGLGVLAASVWFFSGLGNYWAVSRKIKNGDFKSLTWSDVTSR